MKKQCLLLGGSAIFLLVLIFTAPRAYADDIATTPSVAQLESQFQSQLSVRQEPYGQPKATSYYDDLADHYEQDQLMRDVIGEGI